MKFKKKKLSLGKVTIQNLSHFEISKIAAGVAGDESVKPGYPCVFDEERTMYVSEPGYGATCPPAPGDE